MAAARKVSHTVGSVITEDDVDVYGPGCIVEGNRCRVYGPGCVVTGDDCEVFGPGCVDQSRRTTKKKKKNKLTSSSSSHKDRERDRAPAVVENCFAGFDANGNFVIRTFTVRSTQRLQMPAAAAASSSSAAKPRLCVEELAPPPDGPKWPAEIKDEPLVKKGEKVCGTCSVRSAKTKCQPCGHVCLCVTCALQLADLDASKHRCPVCKRALRRVFME